MVILLNKELVVIDSKNNIMWQKYVNNVKYSWYEAIKYCQSLAIAGYKDWTLPYKEYFKKINVYFFNNDTENIYWTRTEGFCSYYAVYYAVYN